MSSLVVQRVLRAPLQKNLACSTEKESAQGRSHSIFVDSGHDLVAWCGERSGMFSVENVLGDEVSSHTWLTPMNAV